MPRLVARPLVVAAAGNQPKLIEEFAGRPSSGTAAVSVARMRSPAFDPHLVHRDPEPGAERPQGAAK